MKIWGRANSINVMKVLWCADECGLKYERENVGMAFGGWLSGAIFDLTGSYAQAFSNGIAWNLINVSIVLFLMLRQAGRRQLVAPA